MTRRPRFLRGSMLCALLALGALAAVPAHAGCIEQGESSFQQCIELVASNHDGEVSASAEADCADLAASGVNLCIAQAKGRGPEYLVCTESYSVWVTTDANGQITDVVVAFYGDFTCQ